MLTRRDKRIFSVVAPASGSVVLSALKIFGGFDGSAQDDDPAINLTTHRRKSPVEVLLIRPVIEATKFAYGQRATLGDPAFTSNVTSLEQSYITEDVASLAREKISDEQTFPSSYYTPSGYIPTQEFGTSYLATVDGNGMAISLTTTVNLYWGSRVSTYS
jgi:gamma-glutamyltranspeptidase/glutathione hydrolase